MAIKKKVVFLPYDFDTAIGTNNEGALQFSYNLEDIDVIGNNEDVYNGQQSVLWNNVRDAFKDELKAMYQTLRSQGALSYEKTERMFEQHQSKWPESVINEDEYFTYLEPLINPQVNADKKPDSGYLSMLQGTKEQQRKWWLYNRYRYIDSKYNAGDALTDVITLRAYAKANITETPYADIYASIKYGSYLVQQRATRNQSYTLTCPVDNMNDTEVYIYSASQLASIGDLAPLMVGYANFSNATRLQSLKVGDASSSYQNTVMLDLFLGNNVLLETLDARNCVNLGGSRSVGGNIVNSTTPTIDLSGCVDIKNIYFDGTSIKGVNIPNGAPLRILHLPATITNLTLRNLDELEDLTCPSFANVTTLRIENCSNVVNPLAILDDIPANSRVRIIGFDINANSYQDIVDFYNELDTMRGLDENGNTVEIADGGAQVSGTIHINSLTGAQLAELRTWYPYITIDAAHTTSYRYFKSYNDSTLIATVECQDGVAQTNAPTVPARSDSEDGHYSYTPLGWSTNIDSQTADYDHNSNTPADVTYYAAYTWNVKTYTVTWKNSDNTVLETDTNVPWGTVPTYNSAVPTSEGFNSTGWLPEINAITGDTVYIAQYKPIYTVNFVRANEDGGGTLQSTRYAQGQIPSYTGETPTTIRGTAEDYPFIGWEPALSAVDGTNLTYTAKYDSPVEVIEVEDSWDTVIASVENGTYKNKYKKGNIFGLDLGTEGQVGAQIISFDLDNIPGIEFMTYKTAKTAKVYSTKAKTSAGYKNRYHLSQIKPYIDSTLGSLMPLNVMENTRKTTMTYSSTPNSGYTSTITEKLYLPNRSRLSKDVFDSDARRAKVNASTGNGTEYWLGDIEGETSVYYVNTAGSITNRWADASRYISFCFNLTSYERAHLRSDVTWEQVAEWLNNDTLETNLSLGDIIPLDLGTEGAVNLQLVAFDADDKADGSGKAKASFVCYYALNTNKIWSPNGTSEGTGGWGGFGKSTLKAYLENTIWPLLPESLKNITVDVTKGCLGRDITSKKYTIFNETLKIWIPSINEVTGTTASSGQPLYTGVLSNSSRRIKTKANSSAKVAWWLRDVDGSSDNYVYTINTYGGYQGFYIRSTDVAVVFGLCISKQITEGSGE